MDNPTPTPSTADRIAPIAVALAACLATVAIGLVVLGGHTSGRGDAGSVAGSATGSAAAEAPAKQAAPAVTYTWAEGAPEEWGVAEGDFESWYPIFAAGSASPEVAEAINADVMAHLADAVGVFNEFSAIKPNAYVIFLPEVTLLTDEYLAIDYFHVYDIGTVGTHNVAGEGSVFRLSDGALVSPAEVLGISEAELASRAESAVEGSGLAAINTYAGSVSEMLASGESGYVVRDGGVYIYMHGAAGPDYTSQSAHLVRVCGLTSEDTEHTGGEVIDLDSADQYQHYRDVDRTGTFPRGAQAADNVASDQSAATPDATAQDAATPTASQAQLRADAEARGMQVFEGTIRLLGGEETSALSGVPIDVNGPQAAESARNTTYAFLMLDQEATIDVAVDSADDRQPTSVNRIYLGESSPSLYSEDTASQYALYDGQRVCVAAADFWRADDLNIVQTPEPLQREILYVID